MQQQSHDSTSSDSRRINWNLVYQLLAGFLLLQIVVFYLITRYFG